MSNLLKVRERPQVTVKQEVLNMYYVLSKTTAETVAMTRKIDVAKMIATMFKEECIIRKADK